MISRSPADTVSGVDLDGLLGSGSGRTRTSEATSMVTEMP